MTMIIERQIIDREYLQISSDPALTITRTFISIMAVRMSARRWKAFIRAEQEINSRET
jgi:hypothetical protein